MSDGVGRDTRTTTRWSEVELAWLEATAAREGVKVGALVRRIVRDAMHVRVDPAVMVAAADADRLASAEARRVAPGTAASSPSAAVPSVSRVRLEIVVARLVLGQAHGPVPPARLADARRLIRSGGVRVSGSASPVPEMLVGPGEVELA